MILLLIIVWGYSTNTYMLIKMIAIIFFNSLKIILKNFRMLCTLEKNWNIYDYLITRYIVEYGKKRINIYTHLHSVLIFSTLLFSLLIYLFMYYIATHQIKQRPIQNLLFAKRRFHSIFFLFRNNFCPHVQLIIITRLQLN